jgi:hypothetical protein
MKKLLTLTLFSLFSMILNAQSTYPTPEAVVQENLDFYNQRHLSGFMSSFSDDIALYTFGKTEAIASGKVAIEKLYGQLFEDSPNLHSTILHRAVLGNKVIDHESIIGRKNSDKPIELVMIYEVKEGKIVKMTVVRE